MTKIGRKMENKELKMKETGDEKLAFKKINLNMQINAKTEDDD